MSDHKIEPIRRGRSITCKTCGYAVVHYRANRVIRKPHWRHMTWQQGYIGERQRLRAALNL